VLHALCRCRGEELVSWADRAIGLVDVGDPSAVESAAIRGLGLAATGRTAEATASYMRLRNEVTAGAQAQRIRMGKGWLELALDDADSARRELESAVPTQQQLGSVRISLWAQAWLARAEFAIGNCDTALDIVDNAATQADNGGLALVRPLVHWTATQVHALRGDWVAAEEHLRLGDSSVHDYEIMRVPAMIARAQHAEAQADYDRVLRALAPLRQPWARGAIDEPGFWPWPDVYGNALVMTNRVDEADEFLRPYERVAEQRGHRSALARLGYVRGRIAGARGDLDAVRDTFESALARLEDLPLRYDRARVNFAYGQTLRRAGKRREADAVMQVAREAYLALGAETYVRRCDRELKAGGLNLRRSSAHSAELTPQETAVTDLVARGMSNKEVATELFLSVKTVQYHLTRIYAKLGIRSRSELAARYRDRPEKDQQ
jgi:DNA-binding CsgD family transcriptional regulator